MQQTPIARLMTRQVEQVPPDRPLPDVVARMRRLRISCVLVCEQNRPIGIISERDLVGTLGDLLADGSKVPTRAADVMSAPIVATGSSTPVADALESMHRHGVRRLPVLGPDGELIGIVTQSDILSAHSRELERLHERLEENVARRTRELMGVVERLETLSLQDALLEIGNRRAMEATLDRIHEAALRFGRPYGLVLLDVDRFKRFNDRYGHAAGDRVLRRLADALKQTLRRSDVLFRYGGEEILAVLGEASPEAALGAAERLRAAVEALGIPHEDADAGVVTVSAGVAAWIASIGGGRGGWRSVLERSDQALYRAKDAGRNRIASDPTETEDD